ncbi:MAG: hypothetical protein ABSE16_09670 [Verrucomicrobiota bacterium]|jgi:hypothetical protein
MNENEPPAITALFEKYKPSPRDFMLAHIAAKVEVIELMLTEHFYPHGSQKRQQVSDRNVADVLELTEGFLQLLARKDDAGGPAESSENN